MDEVFWGCLCGIALLGVAGMGIGVIVLGVVLHSGLVLATGIVTTILLIAIFALGRDREPRERREIQKGARWP